MNDLQQIKLKFRIIFGAFTAAGAFYGFALLAVLKFGKVDIQVPPVVLQALGALTILQAVVAIVFHKATAGEEKLAEKIKTAVIQGFTEKLEPAEIVRRFYSRFFQQFAVKMALGEFLDVAGFLISLITRDFRYFLFLALGSFAMKMMFKPDFDFIDRTFDILQKEQNPSL